jgi:hypothetical protein
VAEFVYLLARSDEEWRAIKRATNARHGDLVGVIEGRVLRPTDYSPPMV